MYYVNWWYSVEATSVIYEVEDALAESGYTGFCGSYEECTAYAEARNYQGNEFWDI